MFKSNFATYPNTTEYTSYGQNLAQATRTFVAALFAVQPAKTKVAKPKANDRKRAANIASLYRIAAGFDSVSPNLAAELRHIAGRN